MTERPPLFRREALEFQTGQPQGGVLRIDPPWSGWAYWIVLALVVAGVVVAWTARTSETTSGPALINVQERTFVALVPDAASPDLHPGQLVRLQADGAEGRPLAARALRAEVADQAGVRRAGFASSSQPAMLVTGVLAPNAEVASLPSSPRQEGRAVVVLRSQRIFDLFLRQLRGTLGSGDS
ncbi:MAG TPA: hypothetical protein VFA45_23735 [Actinomycetes bacterium]|jgi:hypothetical protein|nr:hypothetical protein [Actinomycetes bacterium]